MDKYTPVRLPNGTILQSGITKGMPPDRPYRASGLLMRGVVVNTYEVDNDKHPQQTASSPSTPVCVYCDVLTYSSMATRRWGFLPQVLVMQDRAGLHSGRVWKPRSATRDISGSGNALDLNKVTNPANMDGDHVLVGFIDDNLSMPVILGAVPHPLADIGNEGKDPGHRLQLKKSDGDPDYWVHRGVYYGINPNGDFVLDTRLAYSEDFDAEGKEPAPPEDGSTGYYKVNLQKGAKVVITIDETPALEIDLSGADCKITIGDGAKHVVLGEALQSWLDTDLKNWAIAHTHPTGMGPSGAPTEAGTYPAYDTAATSTKVSLPDG